MTHSIACLLHFLADHGSDPTMIANHPLMVESMDEALRLGLVEHPGLARVDLDRFWLRLTARGRALVSEGLISMSEET